ncbi:hypothetical protein JCM6882_001089 [Rhodosporidiobolus microsporus]
MPRASTKRAPATSTVAVTAPPTPATSTTPLSAAAQKKISLYTTQRAAPGGGTPFPQWPHPTPDEAQEVCDLLASVHGMPQRPGVLVDREEAAAGCGQVPDVLDALIRTTLSQNTTSKNSTAAKRQMDTVYGRAAYRAVLDGGEAKLEETIRCGGLAKNKAKAIMGVLRRCEERNVEKGGKAGEGELSLDWLHEMSDEDAMKQLISFDSIGIKTASCVLLFCLGRDSFAVDTHVHRITNWLGWTPQNGSVYSSSSSSSAAKSSLDDADEKPTFTRLTSTTNPPTRDQTFYHLDAVLPAELKYPLHSLLVRHGRGCVKCSANGVTSQDFVDTCPIEHLVSKSGKKKKQRVAKGKSEEEEVPVKDEQGHVVGSASASASKATFHPLSDAPEVDRVKAEEDLGSTAHDAVKLEDEVGTGAATSRRSARPKRAAAGSRKVKEESDSDLTDLEEEEAQEEEDYKPVKRARRAPSSTASKAKAKQPTLTSTTRGGRSTKAAVGGKRGGKDGSSVDRDEAEMSGRAWVKGEMHGLEA